MDNIRNKADLEYTLNYSKELEETLDKTKLDDEAKESMRSAAKNIITAELLMQNNPLVTDRDRQYLKDTKDKFNKLKDEWNT